MFLKLGIDLNSYLVPSLQFLDDLLVSLIRVKQLLLARVKQHL